MKIFCSLALSCYEGKEIESRADHAIAWQEEIFHIQDQIVDIHPFLENLFPIALVQGNSFYIYDVDTVNQRYVFVKQEPASFPMPEGIQASFPLSCYDGKTSCIVTNQVFGSLKGYTVIFHEFIHCTQWETCEMKLKEQLDINKQAMAEQNYMWELNHPFPYQDSAFIETYSTFIGALDENDSLKVTECRAELKNLLNQQDYEYMVWQEWKEGFARLIENKVLVRLGYEENHYGEDQPYSRITFYEGGSKYIAFLTSRKQELENNIEAWVQ
jgi:hypothetical protein